MGTRLVVWLESGPSKDRWSRERGRRKPSCCSIEFGQWDFGGGYKGVSLRLGDNHGRTAFGVLNLDPRGWTDPKEILPRKKHVREGEMKLLEVNVVPAGMFAPASIMC